MPSSNRLNELASRARARAGQGASKSACQRASQQVMAPLEQSSTLDQLLPYLQELRAKMSTQLFEHRLQSAMGTAPARQVVFAQDGRYDQLDSNGRSHLRRAILQMLDDYIFDQLTK